MRTPWNPDEPFSAIVMQMEDARVFAIEAGAPISEAQMLAVATYSNTYSVRDVRM